MMNTTVYLIRHGEVENPKDIFYERAAGFPLSNKGIEQAKQTARFLKNIPIEAIYSSPLLRTKMSAEIIKKVLGLTKVYFSKDLLEVKTKFAGKTFSYIKSINYDIFAKSKNNPDGETEGEVLKRMEGFLSKILKKHKAKFIAVLTHGDLIMLIKSKILNRPTSNASIRMNGDYIQQGCVYKAVFEGNEPVSIQSVFKI